MAAGRGRRSQQSRVLIRAPSNLGLRPLRPGHEPGTWQAPQALTEAGVDLATLLQKV